MLSLIRFVFLDFLKKISFTVFYYLESFHYFNNLNKREKIEFHHIWQSFYNINIELLFYT